MIYIFFWAAQELPTVADNALSRGPNSFIAWAPVIVAIIAAAGAVASRSSTGKTNVEVATTSGRLAAETEAYERAKAFDVATINEQNKQIADLRQENKFLLVEQAKMKDRIKKLEGLLERLGRQYPEIERTVNEAASNNNEK